MTAQFLLVLALQLLIAAQGPNVPQDVKTQAISVAENAIAYANTSMQVPQSLPTPTSTPEQVASATPVVPTICTGDISLSVTNTGQDRTSNWGDNGPSTYLIGQIYDVIVTDPCSRQWTLDIEPDSVSSYWGGGLGHTSNKTIERWQFEPMSTVAGQHSLIVNIKSQDNVVATSTEVLWTSKGTQSVYNPN